MTQLLSPSFESAKTIKDGLWTHRTAIFIYYCNLSLDSNHPCRQTYQSHPSSEILTARLSMILELVGLNSLGISSWHKQTRLVKNM